jgi:hypothetical protein
MLYFIFWRKLHTCLNVPIGDAKYHFPGNQLIHKVGLGNPLTYCENYNE